MTGGEQDGGAGLAPGRQPLPPEMPVRQPLPPEAPVRQPLPPEAPVRQPPPPEMPGAEPGGDEAAEREWWRTADVRGELRDVWDEHGREGLQAAHEIGAQISEAITAHLPNPYAAAQRRGLDLRWLHLGVNIPAPAFALLATWGGQSAEDRMTHYIAREGLFAPLGWVLLPGLLLAVLMVLPFGGVLGTAAGGLISAAARGVAVLLRRAWGVRVIGYVLRLGVAVAAWSFGIAAGRLFGHIVINWLTGVSS